MKKWVRKIWKDIFSSLTLKNTLNEPYPGLPNREKKDIYSLQVIKYIHNNLAVFYFFLRKKLLNYVFFYENKTWQTCHPFFHGGEGVITCLLLSLSPRKKGLDQGCGSGYIMAWSGSVSLTRFFLQKCRIRDFCAGSDLVSVFYSKFDPGNIHPDPHPSTTK